METENFVPLCRLRMHRRGWGLTVKELAALLGYKSASHVSRIENSKRAPKFEAALACQVIFGVPPADMFPHAYSLVEDRVIGNMSRAHLALEKSTSPTAQRKRELYEAALQRAIDGTRTSAGV